MSSIYPLNITIKAKNYKCFGDEAQGFDNLQPVNLIIGRNNSGKSALIDLVKFLTAPYDLTGHGHVGRNPEFFLTTVLTEPEIKRVFSDSTSVSELGNLFTYGSRYTGHSLTTKLSQNPNSGQGASIFVSIDNTNTLEELSRYEEQFDFKANLAKNQYNPLRGKTFKKIGAERDIQPEGDNKNNLYLAENGQGATNIIQNWLNQDGKDASLIEQKLLAKLNEIFGSDGTFTRILIKKKENEAWEVYLEEDNKGLVSLSNSGSGLKTIILVLLNTIIIPKLESKELDNYIFAFEELENNLHPALLRRLLIYITNLQKEAGCCFLLTTHSSVTIDFYSRNEESQTIHVRNGGNSAVASRTLGYKDNVAILNDLDVRASDLLQSNGIIWVEGPSDRTYLNRWIEIWSEGKLEEGIHYQCLMYGGKLLSHLTANNPDEKNEGIAILRANRNLVLLMDSDKDSAEKELNDTKKRILTEIQDANGMTWVTAGREIENYLPVNAIRELYGNQSLLGAKQYTKLPDYLKQASLETGKDFVKTSFAEKILPLLTKEDLVKVLDLDEKMKSVCTRIGEWNGLNLT